jgi:hypothetical protein
MSIRSSGYNYGTYDGQPSQQINPYDNFIANLKDDSHPNFLWYTLHALEKHAYSQQADCFRAIRVEMEEKFKLEKRDPWTEVFIPKD